MELSEINLMQIELMKESDIEPFTWIQRHSANFRKIISEGVVSIDEIKFLLYRN